MILMKLAAVFHSLPSNNVGWVGHYLESFAIIRDSSMAHHRVSWTDCQPLGPFDWLERFFRKRERGLM